jgi:hypothetical protein
MLKIQPEIEVEGTDPSHVPFINAMNVNVHKVPFALPSKNTLSFPKITSKGATMKPAYQRRENGGLSFTQMEILRQKDLMSKR